MPNPAICPITADSGITWHVTFSTSPSTYVPSPSANSSANFPDPTSQSTPIGVATDTSTIFQSTRGPATKLAAPNRVTPTAFPGSAHSTHPYATHPAGTSGPSHPQSTAGASGPSSSHPQSTAGAGGPSSSRSQSTAGARGSSSSHPYTTACRPTSSHPQTTANACEP